MVSSPRPTRLVTRLLLGHPRRRQAPRWPWRTARAHRTHRPTERRWQGRRVEEQRVPGAETRGTGRGQVSCTRTALASAASRSCLQARAGESGRMRTTRTSWSLCRRLATRPLVRAGLSKSGGLGARHASKANGAGACLASDNRAQDGGSARAAAPSRIAQRCENRDGSRLLWPVHCGSCGMWGRVVERERATARLWACA